MLKDLKLALEAAGEVHCRTELGEKSKDIYERLTKEGLAKKDFGVIYDNIIKAKH
jgi:3-hydroxyisobutyrate dehydrogenase-like beta-hydroxyacid dehydrogenase